MSATVLDPGVRFHRQPPVPRRRVASASPTSEAVYRRRRAVVGVVAAVIVAVTAVAAHDVLAGSGGVPASAAAGRPALARTTIIARSGDSLWSIAERHHGEIPMTRFVDKLVDLNGGPSVQVGQSVILP
jgi:nucleoid-associated protein YgaU